jgi:hypothetical protein
MSDGFVHRDVLFELTGHHPHAGEKAHLVGATPESMTQIEMFGVQMDLLELVDCPHGTDRCYASKKQIRLLKRP